MKSKNAFATGQHPAEGQLGGISGVFVREVSPPAYTYKGGKTFELLGFYADGLVLDATIFLRENFPLAWPNIKKWFHRESEAEISRGEYYTSGKHIWFSTTATYPSEEISTVTIDYSGICSGNTLRLDSYSHANGHESAGIEYIKVEVDLR